MKDMIKNNGRYNGKLLAANIITYIVLLVGLVRMFIGDGLQTNDIAFLSILQGLAVMLWGVAVQEKRVERKKLIAMGIKKYIIHILLGFVIGFGSGTWFYAKFLDKPTFVQEVKKQKIKGKNNKGEFNNKQDIKDQN